MSTALAFAAATLAVLAAVELAPLAARRAASRTGAVAGAVDAMLRLGREGREPGAVERRRLLALGALAALAGGTVVLGPRAGMAVGVAAPLAVGRVLQARRLAYRRAVGEAAPQLALALADALSGGHSLRGALYEASKGLRGPAGAELRRVTAELEAGQTSEAALEGLRRRIASPSLDAIVAAALVHRRSGGDLGGLLRRLARGFEDQRRVEDEVRAATAQARFTGLLVVVLPLGGALLAELASPGFLSGIASSFLTAWLVGIALVLQLVAAVLIRRLGRVRT